MTEHKPIDNPLFWKERLETAVRTRLHHAVYVCRDDTWTQIGKAHMGILRAWINVQKDKVLDAGCGYGRMATLFDHYTGVDFSPDLLEKARELNPGETFVQADLKVLPFADKQFDWAFCVSIRTMVATNLGEGEWMNMQKELRRVAHSLLILEYEEPEKYEIL